MLGPFATASRFTLSFTRGRYCRHVARRLRIDVHDNDDDDNDNVWQRGPLWPHRMGPTMGMVPPSKWPMVWWWRLVSISWSCKQEFGCVDFLHHHVCVCLINLHRNRVCQARLWSQRSDLWFWTLLTVKGSVSRYFALVGVHSIVMSVYVCLSVSLSVCNSAFIYWTSHVQISPNFLCCLWPWLSPTLMALWYVMYFWFCGWRRFFFRSVSYDTSCAFLRGKSIMTETAASVSTKFCSLIKICQYTSWFWTSGVKSAIYNCLVCYLLAMGWQPSQQSLSSGCFFLKFLCHSSQCELLWGLSTSFCTVRIIRYIIQSMFFAVARPWGLWAPTFLQGHPYESYTKQEKFYFVC